MENSNENKTFNQDELIRQRVHEAIIDQPSGMDGGIKAFCWLIARLANEEDGGAREEIAHVALSFAYSYTRHYSEHLREFSMFDKESAEPENDLNN